MISTLAAMGFTVLTSVLVAITSAWLTASFAYRQFRAERAWEKRFAAYESIIQSLHKSKAAFDELLIFEARHQEVPEERSTQLSVDCNAARQESERAVELAPFLFSENALERMKSFREELRNATVAESYVQHLLENSDAMKSCLNDFVSIADSDLKIPKGWRDVSVGASHSC